MFTGIIDRTARVKSMTGRGSGKALSIESPWRPLPELGESISVNGACLTVISANDGEIFFDVSAETAKKTTVGNLLPGDMVNLERALRVGSDISGHFVSGHVDGVGEVVSLASKGGFADLKVRIPSELSVYLVPKGSVAVDGISLTIASLEADAFTVAVIPETVRRTTLDGMQAGRKVNIETDMLGKYVVRFLSTFTDGARTPGVTLEQLRRAGW